MMFAFLSWLVGLFGLVVITKDQDWAYKGAVARAQRMEHEQACIRTDIKEITEFLNFQRWEVEFDDFGARWGSNTDLMEPLAKAICNARPYASFRHGWIEERDPSLYLRLDAQREMAEAKKQ